MTKILNGQSIAPALVVLTLVGLLATNSVVSAQAAPSRRSAASIIIAPRAARVCPGQQIDATYVERLADGTRVDLSPHDVRSPMGASSDSAVVSRDGSWQTSADPMRSVLTGFRLTASLASDSSIRGDTVVAPSYDCPRPAIKLPFSDRFHFYHAYVRLGTFRTPFYDSVVVAVVELEGRVLETRVLSPRELRPGTIKVSAPGKTGTTGRGGRPGVAGNDCSNGEQGEDGERGEPGQPGGQVDIIVEEGSPWLADLVAVVNPGGRGGTGGAGGMGGPPAARTGTGTGACRPKAGRQGRPGDQGPDGEAGQPPKVTSAPVQLLWSGSPVWATPASRRAIEGLLAFDPRK